MSRGERIVGLFAVIAVIVIVAREYFSGNGGLDFLKVNTNAPGIDAFANALASTEGGRAVRNNNPGNLKFAGQPGATPDKDNFAVFATPESGFDALKRQIELDARRNPNWTITQYMAHYLGGNADAPVITAEGNPFTKAEAIISKLGLSLGATLRDVLGG